jgi:hypothetical protein
LHFGAGAAHALVVSIHTLPVPQSWSLAHDRCGAGVQASSIAVVNMSIARSMA